MNRTNIQLYASGFDKNKSKQHSIFQYYNKDVDVTVTFNHEKIPTETFRYVVTVT